MLSGIRYRVSWPLACTVAAEGIAVRLRLSLITEPGAHLLADGRAEVPVELPPFGSSILVFNKGLGHPDPLPVRATQTMSVNVVKPWTIQFQSDRGAPDVPVEAPVLKSWSESSDPGIRYFSGTATYQVDVAAPTRSKGDRVWLRFSDVREIAQVTINGEDAGTVWAKPLMLRVDKFLKPGKNHLHISVTNLWPNRIIGDLQPNAPRYFTSTNIRKYKEDSSLLPSGLIGPVSWVIERYPAAGKSLEAVSKPLQSQ